MLFSTVVARQGNRTTNSSDSELPYLVAKAFVAVFGSVPFWYGSVLVTTGSGSCSFRQWPSRRQQKIFFFLKVFMLIIFRRYIYIIHQRQNVMKKSQNSRNQDFSSFFCLLMEGYGSVQINYGSRYGSRRPKNIRILNTNFSHWKMQSLDKLKVLARNYASAMTIHLVRTQICHRNFQTCFSAEQSCISSNSKICEKVQLIDKTKV